jgi:hypothetical protein
MRAFLIQTSAFLVSPERIADMSTHSAIVPLHTLAKRLPKLNYSKNDRQNLKQLDPENEAKARLKLAVVFCFLRRQGRCRLAHIRMSNIETVMDEIEIELGLPPRRSMSRGGMHDGTFSLAGAAQLRKWVNDYLKDGVKGLLDKHVAARFVSIPMTFTKNQLALKCSYDACFERKNGRRIPPATKLHDYAKRRKAPGDLPRAH